jgi:hypothetical protein
MKTIAFASVLAMVLVSVATPWSINARADGPSAFGTYRFVLGDGPTKQIDFEARSEGGTASGQFTFTDEAAVVDQDPDGPEGRPEEFSLTAELDSLTVENNRALMGGTVRSSTHESYVGRWVQLVVEDNGSGEVPDKLTWRVCKPEPGGWTPVDAEDPRDEGASLSWWATDAELTDDRGVASPNINPGIARGCPVLPLTTYRFPPIRGEGQIQVLP